MAKKPVVRTITVALSDYINNFDILGQGFHINPTTRVQFHNDPKVALVGDRVETNFDLMIDHGEASSHGFQFKDMLPPHRYLHLPRFNKPAQACKINHAALCYNAALSISVEKWRKDNGFIPVPTWFVGNGVWDSNIALPKGTKRVVVKPMDGARGIGQFLVDVEHVSLRVFFNEMRMSIIKPEIKDKTGVEKVLEAFKGYVTYHSRNENYEDEGIKMLLTQGAVVQSVIHEVEREFRLITDYKGLVGYAQERNIVNVEHGFPQAVGSGTVDTNDRHALAIDDILDESAMAMLDSITSTAIGPMNSIDLFLTSDGEWGIFEFCNQFGITGIPDEPLIEMHRKFLEVSINEFDKMEALLAK